MQVSTGPITRRRKEIRAGLVALGAPIVLVGGWALLAPHGWYGTFPGGGRHWVSALLGVGLVLTVALLVMTFTPHTAVQPTAIEGGIGYGTR